MAHHRRWSGIRGSDAGRVRLLDRDSATGLCGDSDYSAGGLDLWWVMVMAFGMVSYLARRLKMKKLP